MTDPCIPFAGHAEQGTGQLSPAPPRAHPAPIPSPWTLLTLPLEVSLSPACFKMYIKYTYFSMFPRNSPFFDKIGIIKELISFQRRGKGCRQAQGCAPALRLLTLGFGQSFGQDFGKWAFWEKEDFPEDTCRVWTEMKNPAMTCGCPIPEMSKASPDGAWSSLG